MNTQGSLGQCRIVILEILRYLVRCPDAKDSLDGICKWWLPADVVNLGRDKVQRALDMLVSRCWVTERTSRSAEKIYGLNKDYLKEIEDFLAGS